MYTREDYLSGKCSHPEYYDQFVDPGILNRVQRSIGKQRIVDSADPHFNDIPLAQWDSSMIPIPHHVAVLLRRCGDYPTAAGAVCIAKAAAKQIKALG